MRRKRNNLVIFVAEGRNETEKLYLRDLIQDNEGFTLKKAYGSATDPKGMVKNLINTMKDFDFDAKKGDLALCFIDFDCNKKKEKQIQEVLKLAEKKNINLIISNPCFELWFICHFTGNPNNYSQSKDLIRDMPQYIKGYAKSKSGIYYLLKDKTDTAIHNAKNLMKRAKSNGYSIYTADFSPATDVFKIFKLLEESRRIDLD